jgi:hypothetical protein
MALRSRGHGVLMNAGSSLLEASGEDRYVSEKSAFQFRAKNEEQI